MINLISRRWCLKTITMRRGIIERGSQRIAKSGHARTLAASLQRPTFFSVAVGESSVSTVPPEAERLLEREPLMAHLGTCVEARPHVAPVWYRYADEVVEIVTTGRKLANIRQNPRVALSIQKDVAGETRWMVSLLGTATVIDDEAETAAARRRINEKYGAGPDAYAENTLVRVEVGSATYRTYDDEGT